MFDVRFVDRNGEKVLQKFAPKHPSRITEDGYIEYNIRDFVWQDVGTLNESFGGEL